MKLPFQHLATLCGAALAFGVGPSSAQPTDSDNWQFISTPFLWGSGIEGDYTIGARTVDIDLGFEDLFDVTEMGFQTYLELRKQKFGFYVNPSYVKLSGEADGRNGGSASFEQDFWMIEGGAFYNLVQTQSEKPFTLDVFAGARYWNIDTDFELRGAGGAGVSFGATFEIIDPIVGVRLQQYLTSKFSLGLRADVGGFGISEGDTSDLSWQAVALAGYDINQRFTVFAGYRALGIDATEGETIKRETDVVMHGALLGLQVKW